MKISVDGQEIFELAEWEKAVIKNDVPDEIFDEDMKRRLEWVLKHKVEQCYKRFEQEWLQKLKDDPQIEHIPLHREDFVDFVMSRPDYKNRSQREALNP